MASQLRGNIILPLLISLGSRHLEYLRILHCPKLIALTIGHKTLVNHRESALTILPLLHALSDITITQVIVRLINSCWSMLILCIMVE